MSDLLFSSDLVNFTSTTVLVEPTSDRGREFFRIHFGAAVVSVNLKKTGALEMAQALKLADLDYVVQGE